jgi:predicted glycoside hydrolase/deacetylase ChbG (UPF0249 family)
MTKKLIVNADGFGFTFGNNRGILETLEVGIVRSISTNVNFPAVKEIHKVAENYPSVSIGIHLDLTVGKPVSNPADIPSLIGKNGEFYPVAEFRKRLLLRQIKRDEIERELSAQVEKLLDMQIKITHWDSHENQHLNPGFFYPAVKVAKKYGIERMRTHRHYLLTIESNRKMMVLKYYLKHLDRLIVHSFDRYLNWVARRRGMRMADRMISPGRVDKMRKFHLETWENLFRTLPEGTSEIYCHPSYPDECLRKYAIYVEERDIERQILQNPRLLQLAQENAVELISFNEI